MKYLSRESADRRRSNQALDYCLELHGRHGRVARIRP